MRGNEDLERRLGHRFTNPGLLAQALLRHGRSLEGNERLEFLGDAVLDCVVAEEVYRRFPALLEGELHRLQESLIRESTLAEAAQGLALDQLLRASVPNLRASTLADTLEALFGAVFLDGGYAAARQCVLAVLAARLDSLDPERVERDAKSRLQELTQARFKSTPHYRVTRTAGAAHEMTFDVECAVPELAQTAVGSGSSRQRAEQEAARAMLQRLAPE